MIQKIQLTAGCPNQCHYCYEKPEMEYFPIPEITENQVQILDMNILANPNAKEHIEILGKKKVNNKVVYYELVCGIDFRRLTPDIARILKQNRFIHLRWAWDYGFSQQKIHKTIRNMLVKAGYNPKELSVFILVNWKIHYLECLKKLELLKIWNCKVNDCCYDGGYPKSEIDYNTHPRFNDKRFWTYSQIKDFRKRSRKHNLMVRFGIDPNQSSQSYSAFLYTFNHAVVHK